MRALDAPIIARYGSLDELFRALEAPDLLRMPYGGCVAIHPGWLLGTDLRDYYTARERTRALGLHFVITPVVTPGGVELRRYVPRRYPAGDTGRGPQ